MNLSRDARLLFIGLWNFADDGGNHPASARMLKAQVLPSDDDIALADVQRLVDELLQQGLLRRYEAKGKVYWHVTGWHHQRIDKPSFKHPPPPDPDDGSLNIRRALVDDSSSASRTLFVDSSNVPRTLDDHSPPEGKGKEGSKEHMSGEPDVAATEIIAYLNAKVGSNFQPVKANLALVKARLAEGASSEDCRAVIDAKAAEWKDNPEMRKYLRPSTLFSPTKFAQYVGQLSGDKAGDEWWKPAGFDKQWQATNAGCTPVNVRLWRDGQRIKEPA
ncbi:conserved phage C-terminal domain-containing protein [Paraburkholderia hospita]|uniref:conserved phage C-terminal domain-containing protein n=1 Tax=Paraburkholderia hospita TaxID=169430 RepID=UPI000271BFE5|nr:conserved phage C-terminal domain-containing protein [Paraburkholderia hospita]EUC21464.1 hypothetical protein PMI06_009180 [Burkholderia sp. BT03]SKC95334.1 phage conserved hypothetical protein, C-terminal domain-containing protein [Paraburkholderia hospita]